MDLFTEALQFLQDKDITRRTFSIGDVAHLMAGFAKSKLKEEKIFPPAEGAEEILRKPKYNSLKNLTLICEAMEEFATLHSQRIAEKMVSERLRAITERCKKLEFMIENGLGWEDMRNDITMPHEL